MHLFFNFDKTSAKMTLKNVFSNTRQNLSFSRAHLQSTNLFACVSPNNLDKFYDSGVRNYSCLIISENDVLF